MNLSSSNIKKLQLPTPCELRVWLAKNSDIEPLPMSGFQQDLMEKGDEHEARVLRELELSYPNLVDIGGRDNPQARADTAAAIAGGSQFIYQGLLTANHVIAEQEVTIVGYPDFMIPLGPNRWEISDAKLPTSIYRELKRTGIVERPDQSYVFSQIRLYGWLFEQNFPGVDFELKIYPGSGIPEDVDYLDGGGVLKEFERILEIWDMPTEPPEAVGLSKCKKCDFRDHCWTRALEEKSVGVVNHINLDKTAQLADEGITTYTQLSESHDPASLTTFLSPSKSNPDDPRQQGPARKVLAHIEALETNEVVHLTDADGIEIPISPAICSDANYVMFDVENLAADSDQPIMVYLWGLQVFGQEPGPFKPALADFSDDADQRCWEDFLGAAEEIISEHPGIKFVHWSSHDRSCVQTYVDRYGDNAAGTAATVLATLLDLEAVVKRSLALPVSGTSLKTVEKLTGFKRSTDVVGGDDSIAAFLKARNTSDSAERQRIMDDLVAYNREDLEATWAVHEWVSRKD